MEIGDRIRHARVAAGLSQRQLAHAVGVTHGLVGQWESHRKSPGRENLRRIAEVTRISPGVLLGGEPNEMQIGTYITDLRQIGLLKRFARLSERQQENLLELLGMAGDVWREMQKESHPSEPKEAVLSSDPKPRASRR